MDKRSLLGTVPAGNILQMVKNQDYFNKSMMESVDRMTRDNLPNEVIQDAILQWQGGACPLCGKHYTEHHSNNKTNGKDGAVVVVSDFIYYVAQCTCLVDIETDRKHEQRSLVRIREAGIPEEMSSVTFATWDFSVDERTNQVMRDAKQMLCDDKFFAGIGVVFMGTPGRGKTHLGVSMLRWLMQHTELEVIFESMVNIIGKIARSRGETDYLDHLLGFDVIMLDDIDKLYTQNEWIKDRVFALIDGIIKKRKYLVATTNLLTMAELDDKFDIAIGSRLMGEAEFLRFPEGDDYRKLRKVRQMQDRKALKGEQ